MRWAICYQPLFGVCMIIRTHAKHANTFFYLPVLSTRLHELVWHANGSIKCQTLECHANGQCNDVRVLLPDFKVS